MKKYILVLLALVTSIFSSCATTAFTGADKIMVKHNVNDIFN